MGRSIRASCFLCAFLVSPAAAQSFDYPDFSSAAGLALNGVAAPAGNVLRVAPSASTQVGSAWYGMPVHISAGFDTTFTFQISQLVGTGADGLVFVIQADPRGPAAMGESGYAMGYGGVPSFAILNSVAIEIDTWFNTGDLSDNEISVQTAGTGVNGTDVFYSLGNVAPTTNMSDGQVHTLRIRYLPGTLSVFLDNAMAPTLSVPFDFLAGGTWITSGLHVGGLNLIGNTSAYVGFTASTGGAWENHDVLSWSWGGIGASTFCTAGVTSNGCLPSIGSSGTPSASATSGFTISIANVEGQKQGLVFYGVDNSGFAPQAWGTSTSFLCVKSPTQRTSVQGSGGTAGACDGVLAIDWSAFIALNPASLGTPFAAGDQVYLQGWFRDPPSPKTTMLSDGLQFVLGP